MTVAQFRALMDQTTEGSVGLLNLLLDRYEEPFDVMLVLIASTATMAKSMNMPEPELLEGISAAYNAVIVKGSGDVAH
jgi:hypothetical protein